MSQFDGMRVGLVQFPGSNCDQDCFDAFSTHYGIQLVPVWHTVTSLPKVDGLILPGGFSYGDFLRGGALASHTPIMSAVKTYAAKGGAILGICNGFQILTEAQLLPGALIRNESGLFVCRQTTLLVNSGNTGYHQTLGQKPLTVPIAHGEGRYFIDPAGLQKLEDKGMVLLKYEQNPNGSVADIAGVTSEDGRILGLMPHPERATAELLGGSCDGLRILDAFLKACS